MFNASKAYVRQLDRGEQYHLLQPVMGLAILDDVFDRTSREFYHHFKMINVERSEQVIEGLELVFVELPKFDAGAKATQPAAEHPLKHAWLRFLRETGTSEAQDAQTLRELAPAAEEIREALELSGESAFSRTELEAYDRYWDVIRTERTLMAGKYTEGRTEGRIEGRTEGLREGIEQGIERGRTEGLREGIEQGIEEGIERGIEQGLERGRQAEREALLKKLLASGITEAQARAVLDA
jgi:flagellar biosynthesis/type III secretory pathway protein FliH